MWRVGAAVMPAGHAKPHAQVSPEMQAGAILDRPEEGFLGSQHAWSDSQEPRSVVTLLTVIAD